jgi:hypothetical protein
MHTCGLQKLWVEVQVPPFGACKHAQVGVNVQTVATKALLTIMNISVTWHW